MSRARALLISVVCLALAVVVVWWPWPGRALIRGSGGDVLVVVFLFAVSTAIRPTSRRRSRLLAVGGFALAAEALQALEWVPPDAPLIVHLTLGATFDWWDLLAYAVGLCIAAALDRGSGHPAPASA